MTLFEAKVNSKYKISNIELEINIKRRLEALGLTGGTKITLLHKTRNTAIIMVRGTRLAAGKNILKGIRVAEEKTKEYK